MGTTSLYKAVLCLLAGLLGPALAARAEPPPEPNWTFQVVPYVWLPAVTGSATVNGRTVDLDTSISDIFTESDFVFGALVQMEGWHKRRFGFAVNGMWSVIKKDDNLLGPEDGPPFGPGVFPIRFDLKANAGLFEVLGLYDPGSWSPGSDASGPRFFVQPLVGVRVTVARVEFDASGGDLSTTEAWADPILGARLGVRFGPEHRWSARFRGDFGGFGAGSDFTWNLAGFLGYDFRLFGTPSTVFVGARALYQDYTTGSGTKRFTWDATGYGPIVGMGFSF